MNPLIDSLGIAKDKVDEFEKYLIDSITEYVNQGGQLYAVDATNSKLSNLKAFRDAYNSVQRFVASGQKTAALL
jgi:hypothetical protein